MNFDEIVRAYGGDPSKGNGTVTVKCPHHDDRKASLCFTRGDDGRTLGTCQAGCDIVGVLAERGLKLSDMFVANGNGHRNGNGKREIVKTYPYVDAEGALSFEVVRFNPKGFAQRRPDGAGGWIWDTKGVDRPLYNLPAVLKGIDEGRIIFVVEGEKDADRLNGLGFIATTNAGGASRWRPQYSELLLQAKQIVIVPDNDGPGRAHAWSIAEKIENG